MTLAPGDHYVAMGSSFGAGPGLKPRAAGSPRPAGRSAVNYAHLVADALRLDLTDVTYSGATTSDLLGGAADLPPQIAAVRPGTRLVTITAGGNDIGYLPALTLSSLPWGLARLPRVRRRVAASQDEAPTRLEGLATSLRQILDAIAHVAPDATVVLVDYLTIVPGEHIPTPGLPAEVAAWARTAATGLTRVFHAAAEAGGQLYLPVAEHSLQHHAWSDAPWTRRFHLSLRGGAPYHPDRAGMEAVARLLLEALDPDAG
jgi:lysophospholipase L1-like esterase